MGRSATRHGKQAQRRRHFDNTQPVASTQQRSSESSGAKRLGGAGPKRSVVLTTQPSSQAGNGGAPTPLEADVPYSGLRKGGLLHKHSRQHATKTQCWSSCKDPPFPTPPACPPASTSATSTASTTCLPHLPPTLLPTPRPARLLSYSLPAYTTRRGGPVPGGLPLPRPALLLRSPTTDLATLIDAPFDYRKRRRVP